VKDGEFLAAGGRADVINIETSPLVKFCAVDMAVKYGYDIVACDGIIEGLLFGIRRIGCGREVLDYNDGAERLPTLFARS